MAKRKRDRKPVRSNTSHPNRGKITKVYYQPHNTRPKSPAVQKQAPPPTIPFTPAHRLLLIGEGDLSHALAILKHHSPGKRRADMTATVYDGETLVFEKYPQARATVEALKRGGVRVLYSVDAGKLVKGLGKAKWDRGVGFGGLGAEESQDMTEDHVEDEEGFKGFSTEASGDETQNDEKEVEREQFAQIRYGRQQPASTGFYDRIIFNFPHVGGKSTDVNRQVRANQELLVKFFKAAKPLLTPAANSQGHHQTEEGSFEAGQIIVTLFEGLPYSLWNIRDLARHSGLRVVRSYRFPWDAYPGYRHSRTIGNITSKHELSPAEAGEEVERRGWKGEDREARSFVFEKVETAPNTFRPNPMRRRMKSEDSSESENG